MKYNDNIDIDEHVLFFNDMNVYMLLPLFVVCILIFLDSDQEEVTLSGLQIFSLGHFNFFIIQTV